MALKVSRRGWRRWIRRARERYNAYHRDNRKYGEGVEWTSYFAGYSSREEKDGSRDEGGGLDSIAENAKL